jgi:hypothetical protein
MAWQQGSLIVVCTCAEKVEKKEKMKEKWVISL